MSGAPKNEKMDRSTTKTEEVEIVSYRNEIQVEIVFFVITAAIGVFNMITDFTVYSSLQEAVISVQALDTGIPILVNNSNIVNDYNTKVNDDNSLAYELCDANFFVDENSIPLLLERFQNLTTASIAIFSISCIPVFIYIVFKLGMLFNIYEQENLKQQPFHPVTNPDAAPINMGIKNGNVKMDANKRKRQRERFALRKETMMYFLVQLMEDVPQLCIVILYINFQHGIKGLDCANCFSDSTNTLDECSITSFIGNQAVLLSLVMTIVSLIWNGLQLAQRWTRYARFKNPKPSTGWLFFMFTLGLFVYFSAVITPIVIMFYVYIGPYILLLPAASLQPFLFAAIIGSGFWVIGIISFVMVCGVEAGESCFDGLGCCDACEQLELCEGICCCWCC